MRALIWLLGVWLLTGGVAMAETIEFTLNPTLDKHVNLARSITVSVYGDDESGDPLRSSEMNREYRFIVTEEAEELRWLTAQLTTSLTKVNGQPVAETPLSMALQHAPIRFAFNDKGQLLDIEGLGDISSSIVAAGAKSPPSVRMLRNKLETWWDVSLGTLWGMLAERRVEIGSSWANTETMLPLFIGRVPTEERWTVVGRETPEQGGRVHLRGESVASSVPLSEDVIRRLKEWVIRKLPSLESQNWSSVTLKKSDMLLIDPLGLSEGTEWTTSMQATFHAEAPSSSILRVQSEVVTRIK